MSDNDHYNSAAHRLALEDDPTAGTYIDPNTQNLLIAQTEATLALAYEQRTANLIAVFGNMMDGESDTFLGERIDGYELAKEITGRLGL